MDRPSRRLSIIVSFLVVALLMAGAALFGDYYFDLNDDVLMKDILSGAYTGVPEPNNIQMLYPISAFISLLYRLSSGPDWYGIFLCFLQYLCVFVIAERVLSRCRDNTEKAVAAAMVFLFMAGVIGSHFLFVQYTFTCGLLSATAALLILTHEEKDKSLYLAVVLIAVAYLLRSEMLLLTLPVVGVAILIKWAITRKDFWVYVRVLVAIVLVIAISQVVHRIANMPSDWKEFNHLFDERTELYDFQFIPDYEENKEFYDSIGLSRSEQNLLVNYNFGLDDEINADTLGAVAAYAAGLRTDEIPLPELLKNSVAAYIYRMRHFGFQKSYQYPMSDFPWNLVSIALYVFVIAAYFIPWKKTDWKDLLIPAGLLVTLFACRSALWLFIIARGRDPIRITHPMYMMEIVALLGMLLLKEGLDKRTEISAFIAVAAISVASIPNQVSVINSEMEARDKMRAHYDTLYDYFDENRDNFYFIDVYTSVSCGEDMTEGETTFSEKMFDRVDNSYAAHDLMGGWASKSPVYYRKIQRFGMDNMQDGLLADNVFMVQNLSQDTEWLVDYYAEKGIDVEISRADVVADAFAIYSVRVK